MNWTVFANAAMTFVAMCYVIAALIKLESRARKLEEK